MEDTAANGSDADCDETTIDSIDEKSSVDSVDLDTLPENRSGPICDTGGPRDTGGSLGKDQIKVDRKDAMYCTLSRWILRLQLWIKYMANGSETNVPDVMEFLFSLDRAKDKNAVENLIWGADEGSLLSLQRALRDFVIKPNL